MSQTQDTLQDSITFLVGEAQVALLAMDKTGQFSELVGKSLLAYEHLRSAQNLIKTWRAERLKNESVK